VKDWDRDGDARTRQRVAADLEEALFEARSGAGDAAMRRAAARVFVALGEHAVDNFDEPGFGVELVAEGGEGRAVVALHGVSLELLGGREAAVGVGERLGLEQQALGHLVRLQLCVHPENSELVEKVIHHQRVLAQQPGVRQLLGRLKQRVCGVCCMVCVVCCVLCVVCCVLCVVCCVLCVVCCV
jgi:hypothetical protein